jgi:hypothetical protein
MDSNRTALHFKEETTWGTAASGTYQTLRFTSESFAYNITNVTSTEIRNDRQITDLIQTDADVTGGFNFEFSYNTFGDLLEGALWSDWSTQLAISALGIGIDVAGTLTAGTGATDDTANFSLVTVGQWIELRGSSNATNNGYYQVSAKASYTSISVLPVPDATVASASDTVTIVGAYLRNGTTEHSYTFIREHAGLTSPATQYFSFLGAVCNSFSLSVQSGAILTGSFDYIGKNANLSSVSSTADAATGVTTTSVLNAVVNVAEVREAGDTVSDCLVQGLDISVANNVRGLKSIANLGNCDIGVGKCDVTGTLNAFFKDNSLYDKYLAGTATSISFKVEDTAGNAYIFDMPQIEFESDSVNSGGQDQDVMEAVGFRAYRDPTYTYTIQVSKFDA